MARLDNSIRGCFQFLTKPSDSSFIDDTLRYWIKMLFKTEGSNFPYHQNRQMSKEIDRGRRRPIAFGLSNDAN
jgi:hypothetical protein